MLFYLLLLFFHPLHPHQCCFFFLARPLQRWLGSPASIWHQYVRKWSRPPSERASERASALPPSLSPSPSLPPSSFVAFLCFFSSVKLSDCLPARPPHHPPLPAIFFSLARSRLGRSVLEEIQRAGKTKHGVPDFPLFLVTFEFVHVFISS